MNERTITYRTRTACRLLEAGGVLFLAGAAGVLMGWLHMEQVFLVLGLTAALPALLMLLVGWSKPRETLTWDDGGITQQRRVATTRLGWSEIASVDIRPDGALKPIYTLRAGDGREIVIPIGPTGVERWECDLEDVLQPVYLRCLQASVRLATANGMELHASSLGLKALGALLMATAIGSAVGGGFCVAASGDERWFGVLLLAIAAFLGLMAWLTIRSAPQSTRLTAEGLHHGRGRARLLRWDEVTGIRVDSFTNKGNSAETLTVRGPGARVVLGATTPCYLTALALIAQRCRVQIDTAKARASAVEWDLLRDLTTDPEAAKPAAWSTSAADDEEYDEELTPEEIAALEAEAEELMADLPSPGAMRAATAGVYLVLLGVVLLFATRIMAPDSFKLASHTAYAELAAGGVPAQARVTELCRGRSGDQSLHAHYSYRVGEGTITGRTRAASEGGHTWRAGELIDIVVSPSHPSYSRPAAEPAKPVPPLGSRYDLRAAANWCGLIGLVSLGLGMLLFVPLRFRRRPRKQQSLE